MYCMLCALHVGATAHVHIIAQIYEFQTSMYVCFSMLVVPFCQCVVGLVHELRQNTLVFVFAVQEQSIFWAAVSNVGSSV